MLILMNIKNILFRLTTIKLYSSTKTNGYNKVSEKNVMHDNNNIIGVSRNGNYTVKKCEDCFEFYYWCNGGKYDDDAALKRLVLSNTDIQH